MIYPLSDRSVQPIKAYRPIAKFDGVCVSVMLSERSKEEKTMSFSSQKSRFRHLGELNRLLPKYNWSPTSAFLGYCSLSDHRSNAYSF